MQSLNEQTRVGACNGNANVLASIISYITLLCGIFIGSGLFTRTSSLVQIPLMPVDIIFVNVRLPEPRHFELVLSIITLVLLVIFLIKGSGQLSADEFFGLIIKPVAIQGIPADFFKPKTLNKKSS